jgi:hypothetical protein
MEIWISRESAIRSVANDRQSFYATKIELDNADVMAAMIGFEADIRAYQRYLQALDGATRNPNLDINKLEVPECLQPVAAPSAEPRKKRATAAPSSKASPKPRKKKASGSSTSQKKAE